MTNCWIALCKLDTCLSFGVNDAGCTEMYTTRGLRGFGGASAETARAKL